MINKIVNFENVMMSVISNMNVIVDFVSVDINVIVRRLLEERLKEFNDNVLDLIWFYRYIGDLVECIVGVMEFVVDD